MPWERNRYYTHSVRRNGRIIRRYLGSGPEAEALAARVRTRRAQTLAWRRACDEALAVDRQVESLDRLVTLALEGVLTAAGYHRPNRGPWRRRRV